jgi:hypothetical protein
MSIAFVLGNGTSRQNVDLNQLHQHGKIYGCNALYREFTPDVLIATDRPISTAIQESGYSTRHKFYTRRPLPNLGAQAIPKPYFGYSSGPVAAGIAAMDGHRRIYMLGFDLGPSPGNLINNLYAGTEFYRPTNSTPTFTGNWIKQLCHIAQDHKLTQFVRIFGPTTAEIEQFDQLSNFDRLDLRTLLDRINNKKDL